MHVDYSTCVSAMWGGLSEQFIQPVVAQIPFRHFIYIVKIQYTSNTWSLTHTPSSSNLHPLSRKEGIGGERRPREWEEKVVGI